MGNKKYTLKNLTGNKKLVAILSVLIAFVIWLSVVINQTPTIERTISLPINFDTKNTALGDTNLSEISGAMEKTVSVRVQGPAYIVSNLDVDDINVVPSLQSINSPGQYSVTLTARKVSGGEFTIVEVTPSIITAKFDYVIEKTFENVDIEAANITIDTSEDPELESGGLKFNNPGEDKITITGPQAEVDKVARVAAVVSAKEAIKVTTSYDAEIVLYDANNNKLDKSRYTLSDTTVKVSRVVYKRKIVPVKATFSHAPAGFENAVKYSLSVDSVEIKGDPAVIDKTTEIKLPAIDLRKLTKSDNKFEMPLELGGGITTTENLQSITVTFDLSKCREKNFTVSKLEVEGGNGVTVTLKNAITNVRICAPQTVLNSLSDADLVAKIDVSGKAPGEYMISVEIVSRSGKVLWQIGTYEASVIIK